MRSYFAFSLALGAIVAFNFGLNTVSFSASKEFAIVDFEWCKGETLLYECTTATTYGSVIAAATFLGGAIGSLAIGFLGKYGRRKAMIVIHGLNILGSVLSAASQWFSMFLIGRLIAGVSVGMSGIVAMFLTEICPSDKRGIYGTVYPMFITIGQLLMNAWQLLHGRVLGADGSTAAVEITNTDRFIWRMAQAWPIVFSLIALLIIFTVVKDDTPYVLVQEGRDEDAKRVITLLHGEENVETVMGEVKSDVEALKSASSTLGIFAALKVPKYRYAIIIVCGLSIMQQLSGINVFVANASKLFVSIMGRTFTANLMGLAGMLCLFAGMISLLFVIQKFGRKTLLLFGIGLSSLFMVPAVIVKMSSTADWAKYFMVVGCMGFMVGFAIGFGGIMWLYFAEALGAEYKDAAFGVATALNWLFAAIVVMTSDFLLNWNENATYAIYTAFGVVPLGDHVGIVHAGQGHHRGHSDEDADLQRGLGRVCTASPRNTARPTRVVGEVLNQRAEVREEADRGDGGEGGQAVVAGAHVRASEDVADDGRREERRQPDHRHQRKALPLGRLDEGAVVLVVPEVAVHHPLEQVPGEQEAEEHGDEVRDEAQRRADQNAIYGICTREVGEPTQGSVDM
ncbi:hexose transporter [Babesia caballi]|uniref:Hexose transporter 1 n=1 Tax=Babesia caballi TaxID=5871 RepID=A0AAV4M0J0_BABCB|nr:hexose transporter [Babesia caballi]